MKTRSQLRRADASPGVVLAIVCAGVVLASLDLFIVNVAIPDMARDFGGASLADMSWVLNAYAIVYAALLLLLGRMAESHRRDLGFLLGVAIFTAASAACALASSLEALVGFRIVQAAGAALLTPTSLSLILATSAPEKRAGAVRAWAAVGGAAAALGPVAGGLLVGLSWHWVFIVNVPVGLAALAIGWRRLPRVPGHPVPRPDAFGAALATAGVGALTLGLVKGPDWGWGDTSTVVALGTAVVALGAFLAHTMRHRNPLIDLALFRSRPFSAGSTAMLLFSTAFGGLLLSAILWMQGAWGYPALESGLALAPGPLMVPFFGLLVAGRLIERFGAGLVAALGSTLFAAGLAWLALAIGTQPDYAGSMLGGLLLTGVGVGLTLPTLMATATGSLPPASFATGSAVVNTLRQVGLAVGVAVLVAILGASPDLDSFHSAWWVFAAISLGAATIGLGLRRGQAPAAATPTTASAEVGS
ncbi:DHA2 family efflux MFS transporter permease subunit [Thermoleophilia bacterium SCSIO 60948]|nr:DHA2 family efflux MFS transporter permease subunit [Thermoleophilia bacterium SCSIO 60948]